MTKPWCSDSLAEEVCEKGGFCSAKETRIYWAAEAEKGSISTAPFAQGILAFRTGFDCTLH